VSYCNYSSLIPPVPFCILPSLNVTYNNPFSDRAYPGIAHRRKIDTLFPLRTLFRARSYVSRVDNMGFFKGFLFGLMLQNMFKYPWTCLAIEISLAFPLLHERWNPRASQETPRALEKEEAEELS
jgi:hypothetical protein